jgi:peptidoglycan/xylan/chitin deacetylase (PgdA/CDA1 family)
MLPRKTMGALATLRDVLPVRIVRRGPATARRVALTFDDGPQALTPRYLDVLDQAGVAATFFVSGERAAQQPSMLREYVRRGHQIASLGWDPRPFPTLSRSQLRISLRRTDAVLGPQPTARPWVRPPDGALSPRTIGRLLAEGVVIALWSFDATDADVTAIAPGEVLRFLDGDARTLEALPRTIAHLRGQGFECVTMADLFAV